MKGEPRRIPAAGWRSYASRAGIAFPIGYVSAVCAGVVLLSLPVAYQRRAEWLGWLPTTLAQSEVVAVFGPILICAAGAWLAGQSRAHGLTEWVSAAPRGRSATRIWMILPPVIAGVLAQFVLLTALIVWSSRNGMSVSQGTAAQWLAVPTVSCYLLFWAAVGTALGLGIRRAAAIPIAAVAPYLWYAVASLYLGDGPLAASVVGESRIFDNLRPTAIALVLRLLTWLSAALLVTALVLRRRRLTRTAEIATSLAVAALIFVGPEVEAISGSDRPICSGAEPVTCLDASHASAMKRYRNAVLAAWTAVPRALRPQAIAASPALIPSEAEALIVAPISGNTEPARIIEPQAFAARFADALFLDSCDSAGAPGWEAAVDLDVWWRATQGLRPGQPAYAGDRVFGGADLDMTQRVARISRFQALPPEVRDAWFTEHAADVRRCRVRALPG